MADATVIWRQPYNLTLHAPVPCAGEIAVTADELILTEDGKEIRRLALAELSDFHVHREVGSGYFAAKNGEEPVMICRFDIALYASFGELSKALDYFKKTGVFPAVEDTHTVCPKCKRPMTAGGNCPYCAKKGALLLRFVRMFRHYYPLLLTSMGITLLIQFFWQLLPYIQRLIIDRYIDPKKAELVGFCMMVGIMVLLQLTLTLCYRINARFSNKAANGIGRDLRSYLFQKVEALSLSSVSRKTPGELINRLTGDTDRIQNFVADSGPELILSIARFVGLSAVIFFTNWKLALFIVAPFPLIFWVVNAMQDRMFELYSQTWRKGALANSSLHDILSGIRVVKSFGSEKREIDKYEKTSKVYAHSLQNSELYWCYRTPFINFFISVGTYLAIYYGAKLVLTPDSGFTVGALMQFCSYATALYVPLYWLMQVRRSMTTVLVSAAKIAEVLDIDENVMDLPDAPVEKLKGEVEFKNVSFGYKKYETVLHDVSFHVNPGEMIGIVGYSGVGKSTLINLLLHLYPVSDGQIFIDGQDTANMSQAALRREIGVVLQETFLFYGSIFENIRYSKPDATMEEVIAAARIANAHDFIVNLPDGYNTKVGDRGYGLSGGERQRIAIARAILHNPSMIILDEATASLDTKTEKEIQDALDRMTKGRTTFAIAHRLSTLQRADRLLVLNEGTVAEMGTHLELMRKKGVYYDLVMAQRQTARIRK